MDRRLFHYAISPPKNYHLSKQIMFDQQATSKNIEKKELLKEAVVISIKYIQKLRECQQFVY